MIFQKVLRAGLKPAPTARGVTLHAMTGRPLRHREDFPVSYGGNDVAISA